MSFTINELDAIIDQVKRHAPQGVRQTVEDPKTADALVVALRNRMIFQGETQMLTTCGAPTLGGYMLTISWLGDSKAPPVIQEGGRVYVEGKDGEKHEIGNFDRDLYDFMQKLQKFWWQEGRNQIRALELEGFEDLGQHLDRLAMLWDEEEHIDRMYPDEDEAVLG